MKWGKMPLNKKYLFQIKEDEGPRVGHVGEQARC